MKKILVSVDTEGHVGFDPVNKLIFGITKNGQACGISKIMDILDEFDIKGLFFVDIAEAWQYGDEKIASVLKYIDQRGHNIGVHIHPEHMSNKKHRMMWQYTNEEQEKMIAQCTDFYAQVLGRQPKSFRAGAYGCNNYTLSILMKYGYKYDMSQFYGKKNCHIEPAITCNKIVRYGSLVEVPVTSYKSFSSGWYQRFDKMDVTLKYNEFKYIAKKMIEDNSLDHIDLFIHSFSLLNWKIKYNNPGYKKSIEKKLKKMIKFFIDSGCEFITEESLDCFEPKEFNFLYDETDYSDGISTWFYLIRRAIAVMQDCIIRKLYH